MSCPNRYQIFNLYRSLRRYGEQLKLTDKQYYFQRIRQEFKKDISGPEKLSKAYEVYLFV